MISGNFFNDILAVNVENERATWTKIELTGKKDVTSKKRKKDEVQIVFSLLASKNDVTLSVEGW